MATKSVNTGDIDELFKWVVRTILILAGGVVSLGFGAFTGVSVINWVGYLLIGIAFAILLWTSQPVWR
ncbi:hypothetical protein [Halorubrum sp. N11]|uniref:hypothetical protein n=1 Tax=Halorubrum sp. N11 TaxID=3402276 RepID=UPI002691CD69